MVRNFDADIRYVRTAEGARFYDLPVGSPIVAADAEAVNRRARAVGVQTPRPGALSSAKEGNNPAASSVAPVAPRDDLYTAKEPSLEGPNQFEIEGRTFGSPEGSRIFRPKGSPHIRYVLTPDGGLYAFTPAGQVEIPERFKDDLRRNLEDETSFVEVGAPGSAGTATGDRADGAAIGTVLLDDEGNVVWRKTADNRWDHELGFTLTDADIQKGLDLGDLVFGDPEDDGTDAPPAYADMDRSTFTSTLDGLPEGHVLRLADEDTVTKQADGTWKLSTREAPVTVSALYYLKDILRDNEQDSENETPDPAPEAPTTEPEVGDFATEEWIRSAPEGSQLTTVRERDATAVWTKSGDSWVSERTGKIIDSDKLVQAMSRVGAMAGEQNRSVIISRIGPGSDEESSAKKLYPGADDYDEQVLQDALDGLTVHSGFQIFYGLPRTSPLRDKEIVGALTTHARSRFPDLSPKEAVKAHLRDLLDIEAPTDGDTDTSEDTDQILVGSANPKKVGVQGMNGGSFSRTEIEQAIEILEAFQGKAYKSELNKKGNALGTLDPTSIVGIFKDKTEGKAKFVEHLRGLLGANPTPDPEGDPEPAPTPEPMPTPSPPRDRMPLMLLGESPESVSELDQLKPGSYIRVLGEYYYRSPVSGLWHLNKEGTVGYGVSSESLAPYLRGVTVVQLPYGTQLRHSEATTGTDFIDSADIYEDVVSPGDTIYLIAADNASIERYRRIPTISQTGQRWMADDGTLLDDVDLEARDEAQTRIAGKPPHYRIRRFEGQLQAPGWSEPVGDTIFDDQTEFPPEKPKPFVFPKPEANVVMESEEDLNKAAPRTTIITPFGTYTKANAWNPWWTGESGTTVSAADIMSNSRSFPGVIRSIDTSEPTTVKDAFDLPVGSTFVVRLTGDRSTLYQRMEDDENGNKIFGTGTNFRIRAYADDLDQEIRNRNNEYGDVDGNSPPPEVFVVSTPASEPEEDSGNDAAETPTGPQPGDVIFGEQALLDLPLDTRLIYTRKDGRQTAYTKKLSSSGEFILVTDRGTEVELRRTVAMRFVVAGEDQKVRETPPPPPSVGTVNYTINGVGVGGAIRSRDHLSGAPLGTSFVTAEGQHWTRTNEGWVSNVPGPGRYTAPDYYFRKTAGFRWTRIPLDSGSAPEPWESPALDWEFVPPQRQAGDEIPRQNRSSELQVLPVGSRVTLRSQITDADETWERFNADYWTNPSQTSFITPTDLEIYANQMHGDMHILNRGTGPVITTDAPITEAGLARQSAIGTVFTVKVRDDFEMHIRKVAEDVWISDSPAESNVHTEYLTTWIRQKKVTAGGTFDDSASAWELDARNEVTLQGDLEEMPVGSVLRQGKAIYRKTDENTWGLHVYVGSVSFESNPYLTNLDQDILAQSMVLAKTRNGPVQVLHEGGASTPGPQGSYLNPASVYDLPNRSRVEVNGTILIRTDEGWRPITGHGDGYWTNEQIVFQYANNPGVLIKRLRDIEPDFTPDSLPEVGTVLSEEEILRLPVGAKVRRKEENRFDQIYTVFAPFRIKTPGYGASDIRDLIRPGNAQRHTYTFDGFEQATSDVELGGKVEFEEQVKALPVGATLTDDKGIVARKNRNNHWSVLDQWNYTKHYSDSELVSRFSNLVYESDLDYPGEPITDGENDRLDAAPVGSIIYERSERGPQYIKTSRGWRDTSRNDGMDATQIILLERGEYRLITDVKSMARKQGDTMSQYEIALSKGGTGVKLTLPPEQGGKEYNGYYRYDRVTMLWTKVRGLRGGSAPEGYKAKKLAGHQMALAASLGNVKLDELIGDPLPHAEFTETLRRARTMQEINGLFRAQYSDIQLNAPTIAPRAGSSSPWQAEMRMETWRDYLIESSRLLETYPVLQSLKSIDGENSRKGSFAWVFLTGNIASTNTVVNTTFALDESDSRIVSALKSNWFHGVPKPGLSASMTSATHEFGHILDSWTGKELGPLVLKAYKDLLKGKDANQQSKIKAEVSEYAKTKDVELVAETFENWHNNVTVEPTTEYLMKVMEDYIRANHDSDFRFVKNPGVVGGPTRGNANGLPVAAQDRGSLTAEVGNRPTARELSEVPIGTRMRIVEDPADPTRVGSIVVKERSGTWRRDNGFVWPSQQFVTGKTRAEFEFIAPFEDDEFITLNVQDLNEARLNSTIRNRGNGNVWVNVPAAGGGRLWTLLDAKSNLTTISRTSDELFITGGVDAPVYEWLEQ